MGNLWYPHFPGDYARDTADLTLMEHGAYRLLLDHYYSTGGPLPADKQRIFRLCRAFHPEEQEAVCAVLTDFFSLQVDGYHNGRADRQLVEMAEKRAIQSEKGRRAATKRWNATGNAPANATGNAREIAYPHPHPHPHPEPNPQPDPEPQTTKAEEVGEADVSQNGCDASPTGDNSALSFEKFRKQGMVDRLGHRELKGLEKSLSRSLKDGRLPEPYRASLHEQLGYVQKRLRGAG